MFIFIEKDNNKDPAGLIPRKYILHVQWNVKIHKLP